MSHDGTDRIVHVRSHIVRVDSTETGSMKINQVIELRNDLLHQLVRIHLRRKPIFFTREVAVKIFAICKFASEFEVSGHVDAGNSHHGSSQLVDIDIRHNSMDTRYTVEFISMDSCSDTDNRSIPDENCERAK